MVVAAETAGEAVEEILETVVEEVFLPISAVVLSRI